VAFRLKHGKISVKYSKHPGGFSVGRTDGNADKVAKSSTNRESYLFGDCWHVMSLVSNNIKPVFNIGAVL
jgi:hypothetical protein